MKSTAVLAMGINPDFGEWVRTGLMSKDSAEKVAKSLKKSHELVEVYEDEYE